MSQFRTCLASRMFSFAIGLLAGILILNLRNLGLKSSMQGDAFDLEDLINRLPENERLIEVVDDKPAASVEEAYQTYKDLELLESRRLAREIRILCLVLTCHKFHANRVIAVRDTWGRHCNILLFVSDEPDEKIPIIFVNVKKERKGPWKMTVESYKYINKTYGGQFDWIFKADDDTYAIMEHMRLFLKDHDPNKLSFFGHHLKSLTTYMAGGSGWIISNATLQHFLTEGLSGKHKNCSEFDDVWEDVQMGHCMTSLGVPYVDSRNSNGRQRFFPEPVSFHTDDMTKSGEPFKWYNESSYYPVHFGLTCCADDVISFHHYSHRDMYMLEYMTYGMKHPEPLLLQP